MTSYASAGADSSQATRYDHDPDGQPESQRDRIHGGGGSDFIYGSHGRNRIYGGRGNDVLGQIFGSKDVSRTVAADAASKSGLDAGVLDRAGGVVAGEGHDVSQPRQRAAVGTGSGRGAVAASRRDDLDRLVTWTRILVTPSAATK